MLERGLSNASDAHHAVEVSGSLMRKVLSGCNANVARYVGDTERGRSTGSNL